MSALSDSGGNVVWDGGQRGAELSSDTSLAESLAAGSHRGSSEPTRPNASADGG